MLGGITVAHCSVNDLVGCKSNSGQTCSRKSRIRHCLSKRILLPTFSELAGVDVPVGLDGVSIAPALTGNGYQREREFVIHEAGNGQSIIRGDYKLIRAKSGLALFNLSQDPSESKDIASNHSAMVEELNAILLKERVAEAKGFANTYHRWIGDDQADASVAGNWSDYNYENAGLVYMSEGGAPQASWTCLLYTSPSPRD